MIIVVIGWSVSFKFFRCSLCRVNSKSREYRGQDYSVSTSLAFVRISGSAWNIFRENRELIPRKLA